MAITEVTNSETSRVCEKRNRFKFNLQSVYLLLGVGGRASPTMVSDSARNKSNFINIQLQ